MLKKIFCWIFTILQVLFLIAAYGIQFFSMKRMGMMRYVIFLNREWEAQYPIAALKYAVIAFLVILYVIVILLVRAKKGKYIMAKKTLPGLIAGIVLTLIFILFASLFSVETYRSYYFISLILAIITLIQYVKILLASFLR